MAIDLPIRLDQTVAQYTAQINENLQALVDGGGGQGGGGGSYTPNRADIYPIVKEIFVNGTQTRLTEDDTAESIAVNVISSAVRFIPTKENLYTAVKEMFVTGVNTSLTEDDDASTIAVNARIPDTAPNRLNVYPIAKAIFEAGNNVNVTSNDGRESITISSNDSSKGGIYLSFRDGTTKKLNYIRQDYLKEVFQDTSTGTELRTDIQFLIKGVIPGFTQTSQYNKIVIEGIDARTGNIILGPGEYIGNTSQINSINQINGEFSLYIPLSNNSLETIITNAVGQDFTIELHYDIGDGNTIWKTTIPALSSDQLTNLPIVPYIPQSSVIGGFSKENLYSAVKEIFIDGSNTNLTEDDDAKTIAVNAAGGSGGGSFLPDRDNLYPTVASLLRDGTNATFTKDSNAKTISVNSTLTQASLYPGVNSIIKEGSNVDITRENNSLTISSTDTVPSTENVYPVVKPIIVAGDNIRITPDDDNDNLTIAAEATEFTPTKENIYNAAKNILVEGSTTDLIKNDNDNTIEVGVVNSRHVRNNFTYRTNRNKGNLGNDEWALNYTTSGGRVETITLTFRVSDAREYNKLKRYFPHGISRIIIGQNNALAGSANDETVSYDDNLQVVEVTGSYDSFNNLVDISGRSTLRDRSAYTIIFYSPTTHRDLLSEFNSVASFFKSSSTVHVDLQDPVILPSSLSEDGIAFRPGEITFNVVGGGGGGSFDPSADNLYPGTKDVLIAGDNISLDKNETTKRITITSTQFSPDKNNIYDAVKEIFIDGRNTSVDENETNKTIAINASGGGGSSFDPTEINDKITTLETKDQITDHRLDAVEDSTLPIIRSPETIIWRDVSNSGQAAFNLSNQSLSNPNDGTVVYGTVITGNAAFSNTHYTVRLPKESPPSAFRLQFTNTDNVVVVSKLVSHMRISPTASLISVYYTYDYTLPFDLSSVKIQTTATTNHVQQTIWDGGIGEFGTNQILTQENIFPPLEETIDGTTPVSINRDTTRKVISIGLDGFNGEYWLERTFPTRTNSDRGKFIGISSTDIDQLELFPEPEEISHLEDLANDIDLIQANVSYRIAPSDEAQFLSILPSTSLGQRLSALLDGGKASSTDIQTLIDATGSWATRFNLPRDHVIIFRIKPELPVQNYGLKVGDVEADAHQTHGFMSIGTGPEWIYYVVGTFKGVIEVRKRSYDYTTAYHGEIGGPGNERILQNREALLDMEVHHNTTRRVVAPASDASWTDDFGDEHPFKTKTIKQLQAGLTSGEILELTARSVEWLQDEIADDQSAIIVRVKNRLVGRRFVENIIVVFWSRYTGVIKLDSTNQIYRTNEWTYYRPHINVSGQAQLTRVERQFEYSHTIYNGELGEKAIASLPPLRKGDGNLYVAFRNGELKLLSLFREDYFKQLLGTLPSNDNPKDDVRLCIRGVDVNFTQTSQFTSITINGINIRTGSLTLTTGEYINGLVEINSTKETSGEFNLFLTLTNNQWDTLIVNTGSKLDIDLRYTLKGETVHWRLRVPRLTAEQERNSPLVPYIPQQAIIGGVGAAGVIADGGLVTSKYADGSVTTPKLADGSVTTPKLADDSVTRNKIVEWGVSTDEIASSCIIERHLDSTILRRILPSDGKLTLDKLADAVAKRLLPATLGTANQILRVNSGATGVEYATPSGGTGGTGGSWTLRGSRTGKGTIDFNLADAEFKLWLVVIYRIYSSSSSLEGVFGPAVTADFDGSVKSVADGTVTFHISTFSTNRVIFTIINGLNVWSYRLYSQDLPTS